MRVIGLQDGDLDLLRQVLACVRAARGDTKPAVVMLERWIAEAEAAEPEEVGGYVFDVGQR